MTVSKTGQAEILFLIPPAELNPKKRFVDRVYGCNYGFDYKPAIHLLVLATLAKNLGYSVRFLDCPAEFSNVKKLIVYARNNHALKIVVFFTVWLSAQEDLKAAEIISKEISGVKIVFTGSYPSWKPELFTIKENYFVVRGEPEKAFSEFLQLSGNKNPQDISGLSFFAGKNNHSQGLLDMKDVPVPDRSLLKKPYFINRICAFPATVIMTSRGCSYKCTYCAPNALDQAIELEFSRFNREKPPLRLKDAKDVIDEFRQIYSLGYKGVEICDNQFVWDKLRVIQICEGIKDFKLKWICCARADYLKDKDMLRLMKESGCASIYIGTESFDQRVLDDINKGLSLSDNYRAVELVREAGIEPEVSVLLGASSLDSKNSVNCAIKKAREMNTTFVHYSIALPLPNTKLYEKLVEKKLIKNGDFNPVDNIEDAALVFSGLEARKLRGLIRKCYFRQYLSIRFILKHVFDLDFLCTFKYRLGVLSRFLRYLVNTG